MVEKFKYDYFGDFVKKLVLSNDVPLQIELHPGHNCDFYNCPHCYGKKDFRPEGEKLDFEHYKKLIDDVSEKVNFIAIAGIKSEPLTCYDIDKIIKRIKEKDIRLGIHTKGFRLTDKIINNLNINTGYGDFITFSIDSSNNNEYNRLHGIKSGIERASVRTVVFENVKKLYMRKLETHSQLNINVAYLLFEENASFEKMKSFIQQYKDISDTIRFSFPQVPNKFKDEPSYYVKNKETVSLRIKELQERYPTVNIVLLEFNTNEHDTSFKYCAAQRFLSVIDCCGNVYPCPQVASEKYNYLSYGNLQDDDFWTIWNSKNRKRILETPICTMDCRVCDRKDEELNEKLRGVFE